MPRHRNLRKIEMKEMKRRLLDLKIKVAINQILLQSCDKAHEADEEEIYPCEDNLLFKEEDTPVNQVDDEEFDFYDSQPIYDDEVIFPDQADDEETYLFEGEPIYDEEIIPPNQDEFLIKQDQETSEIEEDLSPCCDNFHTPYASQKLQQPELAHPPPQNLHLLNTQDKITKFESIQEDTLFSDVLTDKIPLGLPSVKSHFNADVDPWTNEIKKIHEPVRDRIQKPKAQRDKRRKQRVFNIGDLIWIYL